MTAIEKKQLKERYERWREGQAVCYAANIYASATHEYHGQELETINPVDVTVKLPDAWKDGDGKWHRPKNVQDDNVLSYAGMLFEMDGNTLEEQAKILKPLFWKGIIQRVVFSGNKSLHTKIVLADEPGDKAEYVFAWRYIAFKYFKDISLKDKSYAPLIDRACSNPSRTTRVPYSVRKLDDGSGAEQELLYFLDVKADIPWRAEYEKERERQEAESRQLQWRLAKMRQRQPWERKQPNFEAQRFLAGDRSDGWKHGAIVSAIASLEACGYGAGEVRQIMSPYAKELRDWADKLYRYYSGRRGNRGGMPYVPAENAAGLAARALG
jgi:hypothetical protein